MSPLKAILLGVGALVLVVVGGVVGYRSLNPDQTMVEVQKTTGAPAAQPGKAAPASAVSHSKEMPPPPGFNPAPGN